MYALFHNDIVSLRGVKNLFEVDDMRVIQLGHNVDLLQHGLGAGIFLIDHLDCVLIVGRFLNTEINDGIGTTECEETVL